MITMIPPILVGDIGEVLSINIHTAVRPGASSIIICFLIVMTLKVRIGMRKGVRYPRMGNIGF